MKQESLSKWLKFIIVGVGICGLIIYIFVIPMLGESFVSVDENAFRGFLWPWLIFIWVTAIPCYIALVFSWKIAANIGQDRSFSMENAKLLKWISALAVGDAAFFFAGNLVFWLLNMNHPGIALFSLLIVFIGVVVAIASAALSHLVAKAAVLQDESDLTI